jgi:hypothetical protein
MRTGLLPALLVFVSAGAASAQPPESVPVEAGTALVEGSVGYTGFGDDGWIHHAAAGGTLRGHLTPRISVAAELSYHSGPGQDRDVMLQGLAYIDLRHPRLGQAGRVEPYVLVGGGLMGHSDGFSSTACPVMTWGGGTRVWVAPRVYVTADARLGVPIHLRIVSGVGVLLR